MKKLLLLLIFIPFIGYCQDCTFKTNEIDSFSKEKRILTESKFIAGGESKSIDISFLYDKSNYIILDVKLYYDLEDFIKEGGKLLILLKNGDVISYTNNEKQIPSLIGDGGLMSSNKYKFKIPSTFEEIKKINEFEIDKIRIETKKNEFDFEAIQKRINKLKIILNCYLEEISKNK